MNEKTICSIWQSINYRTKISFTEFFYIQQARCFPQCSTALAVFCRRLQNQGGLNEQMCCWAYPHSQVCGLSLLPSLPLLPVLSLCKT